MLSYLSQPRPWYITGPLMGAAAAALLLYGGRMLGISGSYRAICAVVAPSRIQSRVQFFDFDWRGVSGWNLAFAGGLTLGGFISAHLLGVTLPAAVWNNPITVRTLVVQSLGGFLVGFGALYAGGCTSGHGIMGLADFQLPSLVAVIGFFVGGTLAVHLLLPLIIYKV